MQIRPRCRRRAPGGRTLLLALVGVLTLSGMAGCAAGRPAAPAGAAGSGSSGTPPSAGAPGGGSTAAGNSASPSTSPAVPAGGSFTVVGDSITSGDQALDGTSVPGSRSWLPAAAGEPLVFTGGWAVPGATTDDMRAGVRAAEADVLLVLAGTNDLTFGVDWTVSEDNLRTIVSTVGVPDVLLATIPPKDAQPEQTAAFNERLRLLAGAQGWSFTDPWTGIDQEGSWAPGTSEDGIHPTQPVADLVGGRLRTALLAELAG
jgi:hypothetical protein